MTKANYDLTVKQREDLMKAYREVAPRCRRQQEAYEKTVSSPAPRYYVSPRQAWEKLRLMAAGDFSVVDKMKPIKRRMYYSLFKKMEEMSQRKEFLGKSLWFICQFLVGEPAPEFFIKPDSMKFIFNHYKKYGKDYREMDLRKQKLASQVGS